ncbi:hypothetical protein ES703_97095 [subsurface metagenome]
MLDELEQALQVVRQAQPPAQIYLKTSVVVESLLKLKDHQKLKDSTLLTYRKRYAQFVGEFPVLPEELDPLLEYLSHFDGETGRHKLNQQSLLNMLYQHAVHRFGLPKNPLEGVPRPEIRKQPIHTLTLEEVALLDRTPETTTERMAWEILLGHGWRQVEARRILAGDVRKARDNIIWCWGKERNEDAPILSETLSLLYELTPKSLPDDQPVLRSRRIRNGSTQPLGEDGISQLIDRLFKRAGIERRRGHDLRRTCSTLVQQASGDEFLAMRLIRDKIPGYNDRYINTRLPYLVAALNRYSPLHLIKLDGGADGGDAGGDGGESNSLSIDSSQLILQLLNQLDQVGRTARQLRETLTGNAEELAKFGTMTGQFSSLVPLDGQSPSASKTDGEGDSLFMEKQIKGVS